MNKKNNRKGFTIVELVIVIAVIAILATVLVPVFGDVIDKANASKNLQAARNALTNYMVDHAQDGNDDLIIKVGKSGEEVYYVVVGGQLQETAYTSMTHAANETTACAICAFEDITNAVATQVTNSTTIWTVAAAN